MSRVTLSDVKAAQPQWFSRENKRFFGDLGYRVLHGKKSGRAYLVRSTCAWSDMLGKPKTCHFAINPIAEDLRIQPLVKAADGLHKQFGSIDQVHDWMRSH